MLEKARSLTPTPSAPPSPYHLPSKVDCTRKPILRDLDLDLDWYVVLCSLSSWSKAVIFTVNLSGCCSSEDPRLHSPDHGVYCEAVKVQQTVDLAGEQKYASSHRLDDQWCWIFKR